MQKKLIDFLKIPPYNYLLPGKVEVFNVIKKILPKQYLLSLKNNTHIVLVYDTDVNDDSMLKMNIEKIKKYGFKNIIHIQSIKNFEDELVFSSSINNVHKIFNTQGLEEFKKKFIHCGNLLNKLYSIKFEKEKIWIRESNSRPFSNYNTNKNLIIN